MEQLNPLLLSLAAQLRTSAANMEGIATTIEQIAALPAEPAPVTPDPVEPSPVEPTEPTQPDPTPVDPAPEPAPQPSAQAPWQLLSRSSVDHPREVVAPAGQNDIYIPVTLDHTDFATVQVTVEGLRNVSGGGINVGSYGSQMSFVPQKVYTWSPGDDRTHYVRIRCPKAGRDGQAVQVLLRQRGSARDNSGVYVTCRFADGAQHPDMPEQFHRPMRRLDLSKATRKNRFVPVEVKHSPTGGQDTWKTALAHGRSQIGNGETGYYMDDSIDRAENPVSYDAAEKAIRLHTMAFPDGDPLLAENRVFRHQAAIIQGQEMDAVCGTAGVWRMVAKTPNRQYAWPAFWLIGRSRWGTWPPEIDIMEQFNRSWGADYPMNGVTTSYGQHWGPAGKNNRVGSLNPTINLSELGIDMQSSIWDGYHSYACAVVYDEQDTLKSEVVFFFDDIEIGTQRLMARHEDMTRKVEFFPMANVAVRAPSSSTASSYNGDGSGDMLIRDIGYWPSGFAF